MATTEGLEALADPYCFKIIMATSRKPKSAITISEEQGVPIAACYRKIKQLEKMGIITCVERKLTRKGKRVSIYMCALQNMLIYLDTKSHKLTVRTNISGVQEFRSIGIDGSSLEVLPESQQRPSMLHTFQPEQKKEQKPAPSFKPKSREEIELSRDELDKLGGILNKPLVNNMLMTVRDSIITSTYKRDNKDLIKHSRLKMLGGFKSLLQYLKKYDFVETQIKGSMFQSNVRAIVMYHDTGKIRVRYNDNTEKVFFSKLVEREFFVSPKELKQLKALLDEPLTKAMMQKTKNKGLSLRELTFKTEWRTGKIGTPELLDRLLPLIKYRVFKFAIQKGYSAPTVRFHVREIASGSDSITLTALRELITIKKDNSIIPPRELEDTLELSSIKNAKKITQNEIKNLYNFFCRLEIRLILDFLKEPNTITNTNALMETSVSTVTKLIKELEQMDYLVCTQKDKIIGKGRGRGSTHLPAIYKSRVEHVKMWRHGGAGLGIAIYYTDKKKPEVLVNYKV